MQTTCQMLTVPDVHLYFPFCLVDVCDWRNLRAEQQLSEVGVRLFEGTPNNARGRHGSLGNDQEGPVTQDEGENQVLGLKPAADVGNGKSSGMKVLPARVLGPESLLMARDRGLLPVGLSPTAAAPTITFQPLPETTLAPEMERDETERKEEQLGAGVFAG